MWPCRKKGPPTGNAPTPVWRKIGLVKFVEVDQEGVARVEVHGRGGVEYLVLVPGDSLLLEWEPRP